MIIYQYNENKNSTENIKSKSGSLKCNFQLALTKHREIDRKQVTERKCVKITNTDNLTGTSLQI